MADLKIVIPVIAMLPIMQGQTDLTTRAPYSHRAGITRANWDAGGEQSHWVYLHASEVFPAAMLHRAEPQRSLPIHLRPEIGNFEIDPSLHQTLSAWLPSSPLDGFIVAHKGAIVYEQYPKMQPRSTSDFLSHEGVCRNSARPA